MIPIERPAGVEGHIAGIASGKGQQNGLRALLFGAVFVAGVLGFWGPLRSLWNLTSDNETYSYIPLVPVIVLGLVYYERKRLFQSLRYSFGAGSMVFSVAVVLVGLAVGPGAHLGLGEELFLKILSFVALLIAGFVAIFGVPAFRSGRFALLLMLLMVPLPPALMDKPIVLVQHGSADVTYSLYRMLGIPAFRQGMFFSLPGLDFEVAYECSGIHSTLALLIGSLLAGHMYLKTTWAKLFLVGAVLPIVCFTNGLRVFILSILAIYVDPGFFHGNLHHRGGVFFFALGLLLLAVLVKLLQRSTVSKVSASSSPQAGASR